MTTDSEAAFEEWWDTAKDWGFKEAWLAACEWQRNRDVSIAKAHRSFEDYGKEIAKAIQALDDEQDD